MDGYALRSIDTVTASINTPVSLQLIGCIRAGDKANELPNELKNTAYEIMTGAPIPTDYDAVIRLEDVLVSEESKTIAITRPVVIKENYRAAGEDFHQGQTIIKKGEYATPQHIMALAAAGISEIVVTRRPSIAVICTGKEIVDDTLTPLKPGQIRNASAPYLRSILPLMGADLASYISISDEPEQFTQAVRNLLEQPSPPDIILTTGGVSMGRWDFIPDTLQALKAKLLFHKVKIRPGKPVLFAKLKKVIFSGYQETLFQLRLVCVSLFTH